MDINYLASPKLGNGSNCQYTGVLYPQIVFKDNLTETNNAKHERIVLKDLPLTVSLQVAACLSSQPFSEGISWSMYEIQTRYMR